MKHFRKQLLINILVAIQVLAVQGIRAESWPMFQGNKEHTGYTAISLKPDQSEVLWSEIIGTGHELNPVTAADGKVYASARSRFQSADHLFVLDADTGAINWTQNFGDVSSVNPPSYAYGNVYIQTGKGLSGSPNLYAFDAETGEIIFESAFSAQWESYYAPAIEDGVVYVNGGYYGGMYAFDAYSGAQLWFTGLAQYDDWTPAIGSDYVYGYVGGDLSALDKESGDIEFSIRDPHFDWMGWSMNTVPAIGDDGLIYAVHDGRLMTFDTTSRGMFWENDSSFKGQPSYANGVVYALNGSNISAVSPATGEVLWSWTPAGDTLTRNVIVTDSHLIVGSAGSTYLVDLKTHGESWSYPKGGHLSFADGVLYIASSDGTLTAISIPDELLSLDFPEQASEGDGVLSGSVSVITAPASNLVVNLYVDDASALEVPSTVTIPAGETNATFDITMLDDQLLDGTQQVTLLAVTEYEGYSDGSAQMRIHDNESAVLALSLPQTTYEGAGSVAGALIVNQTPVKDIAVELLSNNPSEVGSGSVTIPAGQAFVSFSLPVYDDTMLDGIQTATIEARVENWRSGQASVFVVDNETNGLDIQLPTTFGEADSEQPGVGSISLSFPALQDVNVLLTCSSPAELTVPTYVTIPVGATQATFDVEVLDDARQDGTSSVSVLAQAPGYIPDSCNSSILDDDPHHLVIQGLDGDISLLEAITISLSAQTIDDQPAAALLETVSFTASGDRGAVAVVPEELTNPADGTVSTSISFGNLGNDVTLTASAGNISGTSTAFNVVGSQMVITPDSLTNTSVVAGETYTRTMVISNAGNANLEYEIQGAGVGSENPAVPIEGLIAYLPFNGNANDEYGHDGTVNGATLSTDRFGNPDAAYDFNGSSDFINCGNIIAGFSNFTVSAWINIDTYTDTKFMGPWSQQSFSGTARCNYRMFTGTDTAAGCFGTVMSWVDGTALETRVGYVLPVGEWHLITQTYDGNEVRQYDNGVLVNTVSSPGHIFDNNFNFMIGRTASFPGGFSTQNHYFDGKIDELRIYDRALSEAEIEVLVNEKDPADSGDPDAGLVASYPFNGNAIDETGNGHDGEVLNGCVFTNDSSGRSCIYFDGIDDAVRVPGHSDFALTNYTLAAWIRPQNNNNSDGIYSIVSTVLPEPTSGVQMALSNWKLRGTFRNSLASPTHSSTTDEAIANVVSDWHHVVTRSYRSGANQIIELYINGVLVKSEAFSTAIPTYDNQPLLIGINGYSSAALNGWNNDTEFEGFLDDVRIYNDALTDQEIGELYNEIEPVEGIDLDAGLVASYPFNGDAVDESGNGHDGTVNGATLTTDRFGNADSAYHFDGEDDIVSIADHDDFTVTDVTVCAWVKTLDKSDYKHITSCYGTGMYSDWYNFSLTPDSGFIRWAADPGGAVTVPVVVGTTDLSDDDWHFVAAVRDTATAQLKVFVDGILQNTATDNYSTETLNPEVDFWIGGRNNSSTRYFNGDIDDVRIYNRAMSEAEIGELYNVSAPVAEVDLDTGLIASYPFNGNANDESGDGWDGTVYGATLTTNRFGDADSAYSFDGVNDYIDIGNCLGTEQTPFTLSLWVCTTAGLEDSSDIYIAKKDNGAWEPGQWGMSSGGKGKVQFIFNDFDGNNVPPRAIIVERDIRDGIWHHLCATMSVEGSKLYIDGELVGTNNVSQLVAQHFSKILIGRRVDSFQPYHTNGILDDIRIYNRALTDAEVEALVNEESPESSVDLETGLIASYPFTGNANDESGNGHDGSVNGATLTTDRFGDADSAYAFDGVNDYIRIGSEPNVSAMPDYAVSVWFLNDGGGTFGNYGQKVLDKTSFYHDFYLAVRNNGALRYHLYEGSTAGVIDNTYDYRDSLWHHAVIQKSANVMSMWVDGEYIGAASNAMTVSSSSDLLIGYTESGDSLQRVFWSGKIDDVHIYNRTLSEAEIAALYTFGEDTPDMAAPWLSVTPTTGTVAPGESVEVSVTFDASGLEVGTLSNATLLVTCNDALSPSNSVAVSMRVVAAEATADADSDGMGDIWEQANFGNAEDGDPMGDPDGDGLCNLDEYIAGTDPASADSFFVLHDAASLPDGRMVISWNAAAGRVYSIYWAPSLTTPFQLLDSDIFYPQNSYTDRVDRVESSGFYKVGVEIE